MKIEEKTPEATMTGCPMSIHQKKGGRATPVLGTLCSYKPSPAAAARQQPLLASRMPAAYPLASRSPATRQPLASHSQGACQPLASRSPRVAGWQRW